MVSLGCQGLEFLSLELVLKDCPAAQPFLKEGQDLEAIIKIFSPKLMFTVFSFFVCLF